MIKQVILKEGITPEQAGFVIGAPKTLTIYSALKAKLGREPSNAELKADWNRILEEEMQERAAKCRLNHQR